MRFDGKCALVTGGGNGIGRAVCLAFSREGAAVAVFDISRDHAEATAQDVRNAGGNALAFTADVGDPEAVQTVVERTAAGLGAIDVLVNSAGIREIIPFLDLPFAEWRRVIATNLTGTFLFAQSSARQMVAQGRGGKIVNVSSVAGITAVPKRAAYVSSKHAVVGLTKELALELGDKNIQVNAVAPGVVETALTAPYFDKSDVVAAVKNAHPVGRWGQPGEIASLILYLASREADFITGATFLIDGGYCAGKGF